MAKLIFRDNHLYTTVLITWVIAISVNGFSHITTFGLDHEMIVQIIIATCLANGISALMYVGLNMYRFIRDGFSDWLNHVGDLSVVGMLGSVCLMVLAIIAGFDVIITKISMGMIVFFMLGVFIARFREKLDTEELS